MKRKPQQKLDREGMVFGMVITAGIHVLLGFLLAFAAVSRMSDAADLSQEMPVITMELLQWGEEMPNPNALPEIANPEEAPEEALPPEPEQEPEETSPPEQEIVNLAPPPEEPRERVPEENRPEERPTNPERAPQTDRGPTEIRRPTNRTPVPGSPGGVVGGTSLNDNALARQLATIVRQVNSEVRRPSTLTESEWRSMWALVHITMTQDGQITRIQIREGDYNRAFQMAVTHGLNRFKDGSSRLQLSSVTNAELRNVLIQHGLGLYIAPS
jgi:outer membrane biosynthesis protein TonB